MRNVASGTPDSATAMGASNFQLSHRQCAAGFGLFADDASTEATEQNGGYRVAISQGSTSAQRPWICRVSSSEYRTRDVFMSQTDPFRKAAGLMWDRVGGWKGHYLYLHW